MATTLTVIGGDLFTLALQQYGDATQWWRLTEATPGLTDPMLVGQVQVTVPPVDSTLAGLGLPPQN